MDKKLKEFLESVKMMSFENFMVDKNIDIVKVIKEVKQKILNVCFINK